MSGLRLHQVDRLIASHGYTFSHQRGSHRHYRNARGARLTLSVHGGEHTTIGWRQVEQIEKDIAALAELALVEVRM